MSLTIAYISKTRNISLEKSLQSSCALEDLKIHFLSNAKGESFSSLYNRALRESTTDIVVFIRDDVRLQNRGWGQNLLENFLTTNFGILGVVGSVIMPMSGMVWEKEEPLVGRIWYGKGKQRKQHSFSEVFEGSILKTVVVDGAFFAVHKKRLFETFDEKYRHDSFHDLDICLANHRKHVPIGVTFDVQVEKHHFEETDDSFHKNLRYFLQKNKDLPFYLRPEIFINEDQIAIRDKPHVAILIPYESQPHKLLASLGSILQKTQYAHYSCHLIGNQEFAEQPQELQDFVASHKRIRWCHCKEVTFSRQMNTTIQENLPKDVDLLMFCDPEIVLLNDVVSRMVHVYLENKERCGTIGVRIHQPNNLVRHFGLELFSEETEEGFELGVRLQGFLSAYKYQNKLMSDVVGSSKECLCIPRQVFENVGGFNNQYAHGLEDFELNLQAILQGQMNFLDGTGVCFYQTQRVPTFLTEDYEILLNFINEHPDTFSEYVNLIANVSDTE